ncbi:MAG TPA: hypothetical protein VGJ26_13965 [Pirellulales bacterium]
MGKIFQRRWLQFTLRTMLAVATVVCISLGFWANRAHQQRQAVRQIEALSGTVTYQPRLDEIHAPGWLRSFMGDDFFVNVVSVTLTHPQEDNRTRALSPEELERCVAVMQHLPKLRHLQLQSTQLRDEDLSRLAPLRKLLESVDIHEFFNEKVKGSGVEHFSGWPRLRQLSVSSYQLDPAALETVATIPNLERLSWGFCNLDAKAFVAIARCKNLKGLGLTQCTFDSQALLELNNAMSLKGLTLHNERAEQARTSRGMLDKSIPPRFRFLPTGRFQGLDPLAEPNASNMRTTEWFEQMLPGIRVMTWYSSH